ncbi:hypothetical protein [Streptomyces paradoxus]|uniref:Uncharacterized protein n=1 Tax=Streptomyces paradoxus TaxID=66375 RepID=A0A7W9WHX7_9ACTN|nr:hypothetical protein [Streptomyces paradoxus]MBB6077733.1 hypothetical protein [Streptomyces paradoxus]
MVNLYGSIQPITVFPAKREQWNDLEACVGNLTNQTIPGHDVYADEAEEFDPSGRAEFDEHVATTIPKRKWNGPTFALQRLSFPDGKAKIDCKLGRYYVSLVTSEACDMELMRALAPQPDGPVPLSELPRRSWAHNKAGDPVVNGSGRSAAVAVATVILKAAEGGGYDILLNPRSGEVATHQFFNHVAPSGIFSPLDVNPPTFHKEFSVHRNFFREYIEELYSVDEYEIGTKPHHDVEEEPEIVQLIEALNAGVASLYYTGISVNLLNLRPEICTLLFIRDPDWYRRELAEADKSGRPWRMAWEWLGRENEYRLPSGRQHQYLFPLNENFEPRIPHEPMLRPAALIPNAAAAIDLALRVVK